MQTVQIREASAEDTQQILDIYNHYIQHTVITFDVDAYSFEQMSNKILLLQKDYPVLVAHKDDHIVGYAYASAWKTKTAYKHSGPETNIVI